MSIELAVYSPDPPLRRERVAQACARLEEASWEIAFLRDLDPPVAEERGPLASELVLGWIPGGAAAASIRAALRARDRAALDALSADGLLAMVSVRVATRGSEEWDGEAMAETASCAPSHLRGEVEHAATFYAVETNARRSEISLEFQYLFWRAVGVLSNGLMEDPQEGEFISTLEEIGRDGEKADAEAAAASTRAADREQPDRDRGALLVNAAVLVLMAMELASAIYLFSIAGWASLLRRIVPLAVLSVGWYSVRQGDALMYWLLVFYSSAFAVLSLWYLTGASGDRTLWLSIRAAGCGIAALLLLLPATRRYGTRATASDDDAA